MDNYRNSLTPSPTTAVCSTHPLSHPFSQMLIVKIEIENCDQTVTAIEMLCIDNINALSNSTIVATHPHNHPSL